jgi:hypothetical protein
LSGDWSPFSLRSAFAVAPRSPTGRQDVPASDLRPASDALQHYIRAFSNRPQTSHSAGGFSDLIFAQGGVGRREVDVWNTVTVSLN